MMTILRIVNWRIMSQTAKREYLARIRDRYQKADKREKSRILNEFCKVCGFARNYAIRKLNKSQDTAKIKAGRKLKYDSKFVKSLRDIWLAMHRICSKKMVAAIPLWLAHLNYEPEVKAKLLSISAATIDRLLNPFRRKVIRGKSLTGKGRGFIKRVIPLKPLDAEYTAPGFIQADTVAHCGDNIAGHYAYSLTMTDIFTGWTENRAVWTKHAILMAQAIGAVEDALPFPIKVYSADNGLEVLNEQLYDYFTKRPKPILVTRGRPYRKNDQAYVEQKNNSHVRGVFGYERIDDRLLLDRMNLVYERYWNPLQNFFIPTMKCIDKQRDGARIIKKYDKPKTPYQRILDSADVSDEAKQKLRAAHARLNPFDLSRGLLREQSSFFAMIKRNKQPLAA